MTFQLDKAHSTAKLIAIFESIRRKTEEEISSKLENSDGKMLEEHAKRTVPRDFLPMATKGFKSIINELIVF